MNWESAIGEFIGTGYSGGWVSADSCCCWRRIGRLVNQFTAVYAHIEKLTPLIEVGVQLE